MGTRSVSLVHYVLSQILRFPENEPNTVTLYYSYTTRHMHPCPPQFRPILIYSGNSPRAAVMQQISDISNSLSAMLCYQNEPTLLQNQSPFPTCHRSTCIHISNRDLWFTFESLLFFSLSQSVQSYIECRVLTFSSSPVFLAVIEGCFQTLRILDALIFLNQLAAVRKNNRIKKNNLTTKFAVSN